MSKKSDSHQSKLGANSLPFLAYGHEHFFHFHYDVHENQYRPQPLNQEYMYQQATV
jgi:hypothetical protein